MSKLVRNLLLSFLTLTTVLLCILCGKIYRKNQVLEEKLHGQQSITNNSKNPESKAPAVQERQHTNKGKVHLVEFCELSAKRFMDYEANYGANISLTVSSPLIPVREYYETYEFETSFANVSVSKEDFYIVNAILTFPYYQNDIAKTEQGLYKCISAMSALEFTDSEDDIIRMKYSMNQSEYANANEQVAKIWIDAILPQIKTLRSNGTYGQTPVIVYTGEYTYSMTLSEFNETPYVILTATVTD